MPSSNRDEVLYSSDSKFSAKDKFFGAIVLDLAIINNFIFDIRSMARSLQKKQWINIIKKNIWFFYL